MTTRHLNLLVGCRLDLKRILMWLMSFLMQMHLIIFFLHLLNPNDTAFRHRCGTVRPNTLTVLVLRPLLAGKLCRNFQAPSENYTIYGGASCH